MGLMLSCNSWCSKYMTATTAVLPSHAHALSDLPEVLQFMQALWAVVHGLDTTSKRMMQVIGVTGPQRMVLRVVGLFPGLSAGDVSRILHVHPSTLTGILQRLVQQRLVTRVGDDVDRRRAVLRLTTRGRRVNRITRGTVESAVAQALERVSDNDRTTTTQVLARLAGQLNQLASPPAPQASSA